MNYSKLQKTIASIIIPFFFFGMVFHFPISLFNITNAGNSKLYSLVSILVNNDIYNEVSDSLETYAKDISKQLPNTKVIIIPTPKNENSFNIASLNEKLYYEGYKGINKKVDFNSKLVGTILVGDFPLPVVYKNKQYSNTILPYVDFEDKSYIYNHKNNKYEVNRDNIDGIKPEIWHGIISPNTGSREKNIEQIKDFFEKDHNFYEATGNFKTKNGIINGKINEKNLDKYEPYVFYFDQIREQKAISYSKYIGYQAYLENKEALNYNRFTKDLADKIQKDVLDFPQNQIKDLLNQIPNHNLDIEKSKTADITKSSDIMTKAIIDKATKDFIEIFNSSKIGDFRKNVNNAGRYSIGDKKVNVDIIPYLIAVLDKIGDNSIKGADKVIEDKIDNLVMSGGLSRYIALPTKIEEIPDVANVGKNDFSCHKEYTNILYGKVADNIKLAEECSIYRGTNTNSGRLVKTNRGLDLYKMSEDGNLCPDGKTNGYWGGYSPLNLENIEQNNGKLKLKSNNYRLAIRPIYDIAGSKQTKNNSKVHSPDDCFDNNYIFSRRYQNPYKPGMCSEFVLPIKGNSPVGHTCSTINETFMFQKSFSQNYKDLLVEKCAQRKMLLDSDFVSRGKRPADLQKECQGADRRHSYIYHYKTIPSYIKHISPTKQELATEIKTKIPENLPIDVDRYIDFIGASGHKDKIKYPNLFRIKEEISKQDSFKTQLEKTSKKLDELLEQKSAEINRVIANNNPSSLSGVDLEIYQNYLKIAPYPSQPVDLKEFLKNKETATINILGENKTLSYYDNIVFSLFWNNLKTVGQKYKFVFENYLSDQTSSEFKHYLPKNKKVYEIAYLGAPGNSSNMYIGVNPEEKGDNPYSNIDTKNALLDANLFSFSVQGSQSGVNGWYDSGIGTKDPTKTETQEKNALFKCAPPEGVSIFKWPAAIACRIKNLSFEITFDPSKCSSKTLFADKDKQVESLASEISDINNNGSNGGNGGGGANGGGSDLGGDEEKDKKCSNTLNVNYIDRCNQKSLENAKIELVSSSKKVYINSYVGLEARILNSKGQVLDNINNLKAKFEIIRIIDKKTNKAVAKKDYNKYVNFKENTFSTRRGYVKYSLNSRNKIADYYVRVVGKGEDKNKNEIININSNILKIEVRKDLLSSTIEKISEKKSLKGDNTILASNKSNIYLIDKNITSLEEKINQIKTNSSSKEKLVISLNHYSGGNKQIDLNYPLKLSLTRNGKKVIEDINITKQNLSSFFPAYSLTKKGEYKLKITNVYGETTTKRFNIVPDVATNMDLYLSTNILERDGDITSNIFILKDKYGNISSGFNYKILLKSEGEFSFPLNNGEDLNSKELTTFQGYKGFRLKARNKNGAGKLNITVLKDNKVLFKKSQIIQTIEKINAEIEKPEIIKVGGKKYKFEINFVDNTGKLLKNLNSRVYLTINKNYGLTKKPYFPIINGKATIDFKTKILAGENIPIELKLEGLREIIKETIDIEADSPMKLDFNISKDIARANPNEEISVKVQLKDRYNNTVFSDNSTKLRFKLKSKYKDILKLDNNSIQTVKKGEAIFDLKATSNPGTAYFRISTFPDLSNNSFEIHGKTINGVGEKAAKIKTYYFWDKNSFKNKKYNALYTVMLGADYGNIKQKDYLASSMLFDKNNRSLAVTSLVNNPYKFSDLISIYNNGKVEDISSSNDLTQDLELTADINDESKLSVNIYNKILNRQIGKINYLFNPNTKVGICETTIGECKIKENENGIYLKGIDKNYKLEKRGKSLFIKYDNKNILEIDRTGKFITNKLLKFELDNSSKENFLVLNVKYQNNNISKLIINISNEDIDIKLADSTYNIRNIFLNGKLTKNIYYNNFLTSSDKVTDFAQKRIDDIENFRKKGGLGWKGENKFLLDFAAGKKVGESIMDKQSFSIITLGDPVISLKPIRVNFKKTNIKKSFNATIGKKINKDNNVVGYSVFDYDNDKKKDILLIKDDGYLKLLENKTNSKNFLNKGNLAYIIDHGNKDFIKTGDFTGDGFEDIFFVNKKGVPAILNNYKKDFKRINLDKQFKLNGKIVQVETFDMDNDLKTDIVTLDDSGEINIFYGGGLDSKPIFTKKIIGTGFGLKLDSSPRISGALVSFNGIYTPSPIPNKNKSIIDEGFLNRQIFVNVAVSGDKDSGITQKQNFIKSEYSSSAGIEIKKVFKDVNGGVLKSGDIVEVEVTIKNISNSIKRNISYLDQVTQPFWQDEAKVEVSRGKVSKAPVGYDYLINNFNLVPGGENKIKYKLKTPKLSYGKIKVGLFEKGEVGDDPYGDIIIKKDNKNCSDNLKIYRSISKRKYSDLANKEIQCDTSKMKLPKEIEDAKKINVDENKNGIPDYIDELKNNPEKSIKHSQDELKKLNKEEIDEANKDDIFTSINNISDKVEKSLDDLENKIKGFACGFGGSSCVATPLNWAPMIAGNDPTLYGVPIGDGLKVEEGIPIYSSYTVGKPHVRPPSSGGAGGYLGTNYAPNTFRLFTSPTLTGGFGTAVCYGGPASVVGRSNPPGVSPLIPGGNCIVTAKKLASCSNDASEGDPASMGIPDNFGGNGNGGAGGKNNPFGVINGNCDMDSDTDPKLLNKNFINKYYNAKANGLGFPTSFKTEYKNAIQDFNGIADKPLLSLNGQGIKSDSLKTSSESFNGDANFEDVIQIKQKRVSPFPSFLMDWVTRQVEEIVTKLTDLPTIFIIVPDFSGIIDTDWGEYGKKAGEEYNKAVKKENKINEKVEEQIKKLEQEKAQLNCKEEFIKCSNLGYKIGILESQKIGNFGKTQNSGIKEAYEFLSNVPIINIEPQQINVNIPWPDVGTLDKFIVDAKSTLNQWKSEVSLGKINKSASSNVSSLISNLEQNISIAEEYKEFPRKLTKLLNQKEIRINQIMCSLESISEITGGWIGRNGKRFKAWVETYILIKAVLKSWQQLIDVFVDYDAECHECKNERHDLLDFQFKLIDLVIPKFPIIQFPKWPDLILDLHNIRASINVKIPDVVITHKPLVLPNIPELKLPTVDGNLELKVPEMPLLDRFEFPELEDLPTPPEIKLPDLPPPPKLPKIFSQLEGVLKILKLITKAMCLLKQLPFVPEWRAGDQVAFLTERNGYLPMDFIDLSLPQFTVTYLDAIKVTSYVNLETDSSFLVDTLRKIIEPLSAKTNNWANKFNNAGFDNLDFSNKSININKTIDLNKKDKKSSFNENIIKNITNLYSYLEKNKNKKIDSHNFLNLVNKSLASEIITSDPRTDKLKNIWKEVNNYNYSKEDKLIADLQKANFEKFETLNKILTNELRKNSKLKKDLKNSLNQKNRLFKKVSGKIQNKDFVEYKKSLEKYNNKFLKAAYNLVNSKVDNSIKKEGKNLNNRIRGGLKEFKNSTLNNRLLVKTTKTKTKAKSTNVCQQANSSAYHYNYKGLYILEKNRNYRLFNYLDELNGNETYSPIDFDNDGDLDLLYFVNGDLYLKENLNTTKEKESKVEEPIILNISKNKYFNGEDFVEAINGFKEINTDNGFLNIVFQAPTDHSVKHFIVEYYTIVDKFLNEEKIDGIRKNIIDTFVEEPKTGYKNYLSKKHLAYINYIGDIPAVRLDTVEMINLSERIKQNNKVNITSTTPIYTAGSSAKIRYYVGQEKDKIKDLNISSHSSIRFREKITIIAVNGKVYSKGKRKIHLVGAEIKKYIGLPLSRDSEFSIIPDLKSKMNRDLSNIEIKYSSGLQKNLNFSDIDSYKYYNLGTKSDSYLVRVPVESDYYYGKIYGIKDDIKGTYSAQKLFAPQVAADTIAPELDGLSKIRIPVYQEKEIDLKNYIYENSGINFIKNISIKLKQNSNIIPDNFSIEKSNYSILLKFNKFNKIFKEKIEIILEDKNGNKSITPIDFEVYSPKPEILNNTGSLLNGKINENLIDEPINIYRVRSGVIKRLQTKNDKIKVYTVDEGNFNFNVKGETSSGLILKENNLEIAYINENTGNIKIKNSNFKIKVNSNNLLYPEINIVDSNGNKIYSQFIKLEKNSKIVEVDDFDNVEEKGLFLKMIDKDYVLDNIPNGAKYSAGVAIISKKIDKSKKQIFVIFPDGRIKYSSRYYISYKNYGEKIILELKTLVGNKKIAEILYKIKGTYLMK